jgi:hypothetical protein
MRISSSCGDCLPSFYLRIESLLLVFRLALPS